MSAIPVQNNVKEETKGESSGLEDCHRVLTLLCTVLKGVTNAMLECDVGSTNVTLYLPVGKFQIGQNHNIVFTLLIMTTIDLLLLLPLTARHCQALQDTVRHCWTLLDTAKHCRTMPNNAGQCQTLRDTAGHCRTLPDTSRHCQALPDNAGHCWTLPITFGPCQTLPDTPGHYRWNTNL